ncbi:MAG: hypothetical protein M5U19_17810 [Microthrixaceae bacterium]|nr:hypothetical protein [Microthrixaceae bacterium]
MDDIELADARKPIAEAIAEADQTEYIPVSFDSCDHVQGPYFHGTRFAFDLDAEVAPGHMSNYHEGSHLESHLLRGATGARGLASRVGHCADRMRTTRPDLRGRTHRAVRGRPERDQQARPGQRHPLVPVPSPAARSTRC